MREPCGASARVSQTGSTQLAALRPGAAPHLTGSVESSYESRASAATAYPPTWARAGVQLDSLDFSGPVRVGRGLQVRTAGSALAASLPLADRHSALAGKVNGPQRRLDNPLVIPTEVLLRLKELGEARVIDPVAGIAVLPRILIEELAPLADHAVDA